MTKVPVEMASLPLFLPAFLFLPLCLVHSESYCMMTKTKHYSLTCRVPALPLYIQDKRRLEREKTYYWGQAEELRISSTGRAGQADPGMEADHALLLEQTKELIEENRELRAKLEVLCCCNGWGGAGRGV